MKLLLFNAEDFFFFFLLFHYCKKKINLKIKIMFLDSKIAYYKQELHPATLPCIMVSAKLHVMTNASYLS